MDGPWQGEVEDQGRSEASGGEPLTSTRRRAVAGAAAIATALLLGLAGRIARSQPAALGPDEADYDEQAEAKSDFWDKALDPAAEKYDSLVERAVVLLREGDRDSLAQAGQILRDAVQAAPDRPLGHLWLGRLADRQGDFAGCAQSIARALDLDPELEAPGGSEPTEWAAHYELAVCRARAGKYEAAIEGLRRILGRAESQQVAVHQRLGECYMALGRLDEAVESFRQGLRLSPYSADLAFALAVAYDRDEDVAQARDALTQALTRDPRASSLSGANRIWIPAHDAHDYLGLAYLGAEDWARSVLHFRRYLALAGETAWARRARARYEEALAGAVAGKGVEFRGSATVDQPHAAAAMAHADGALQACLRKTPDLLLRVSITVVLPTKGKGKAAPPTAATTLPGVRVLVQETSDTKSADVRTVVGCAEAAARKIKLPRPAGAPGTYVTAEFNIISR
jgi:tetratricopeptide (TPR) repeat protein